jgi:putative chitinase
MKLSKVEEGLYYKDPERLAKIYPRAFDNAAEAAPYARNPDGLGQLLYQGYWGRGLLQITWEKNYKAAGLALGFDYLSEPDLLLEPEHAALTAGWFWDANSCNVAADRGDMRAVTRIVNGPALMHLQDRIEQFEKNLEVLS